MERIIEELKETLELIKKKQEKQRKAPKKIRRCCPARKLICEICSEYETTRLFNMKRHRSRCIKRVTCGMFDDEYEEVSYSNSPRLLPSQTAIPLYQLFYVRHNLRWNFYIIHLLLSLFSLILYNFISIDLTRRRSRDVSGESSLYSRRRLFPMSFPFIPITCNFIQYKFVYANWFSPLIYSFWKH